MSSSKAYLTWALNQEGDLVHVDEVPNGVTLGTGSCHASEYRAIEQKSKTL